MQNMVSYMYDSLMSANSHYNMFFIKELINFVEMFIGVWGSTQLLNKSTSTNLGLSKTPMGFLSFQFQNGFLLKFRFNFFAFIFCPWQKVKCGKNQTQNYVTSRGELSILRGDISFKNSVFLELIG